MARHVVHGLPGVNVFRALYATPGSDLADQVSQAEAQSKPLILDPSNPLAQQAFAKQTG